MTKIDNLKILKRIYNNPRYTQRELALELGYSLGKLNYCFQKLKKKGLLKLKNSRYIINPKNKLLDEFATQDEISNDEVEIVERKRTFLIAEIGINHNGSVSEAKELIKLARKYDFDAVKFQKRDLNICISEDQKNISRQTPWGNITYLEYKKKIELTLSQYKQLNNYSKKIGIEMFTSCWDINSLKQMKKFNFSYNKIASAMITNIDLLKAVAKEKKKTFISTGMCTMRDIEKAVAIFKLNKCKFVLMHSVSLYPCGENLLNLNFIKTLKKKFNCEVGYSGHESSVSPTISAFFLGADYIERHITLDRANWGTDQAASLAEAGMKNLSDSLRKIPITLGDGVKKYLNEEKEVSKKMRYWENT